MAHAAILSFEEVRDTQRRTASRPRLHDRMEPWLERLEARVQESEPPLEQLTQAVLALRQELTHAVAEELVEQRHRPVVVQRTAVCPHCGHTAVGTRSSGAHSGTAGGGDPAAASIRLLGTLPARHGPVGRGMAADRAPPATRRPEGGRPVDQRGPV